MQRNEAPAVAEAKVPSEAEQITKTPAENEQEVREAVHDEAAEAESEAVSDTPNAEEESEAEENSEKKAKKRETGIEITKIKIISEERKQEVGKIKQALGEALDESADELVPTESSMPAQVARKISLKQIASALFGFFVLVFAVFGIVFCSMYITDYIDSKNDDSALRTQLTDLVAPLTAMDASTFENVNAISEDVLLTAACWDIIINPSSNYVAENGYYTISYLEIDKRITSLFGSNLSYAHKTVGDEELLFEYDEETGMYSIPAHSKMPSYTASIVEYAPTADGYKIKVAYTMPIYEFINATSSPDKVMLYTVKTSASGYTISSLELSEVITGIE